MMKRNLLLIALVIIISIIPLFINIDAEFGGADVEAKELIMVLHPEYEPWFNSIWKPPSGEIESLVFALQAAIGTGFIGYFFGYYIGKRSTRVTEK